MSSESNLFVDFWCTINKNGSMVWSIFNNKISILYYFNDENIDLEYILGLLNTFAGEYGLKSHGRKLPFKIQKSNFESWNYDCYKRIEFIVKN